MAISNKPTRSAPTTVINTTDCCCSKKKMNKEGFADLNVDTSSASAVTH